MKNQINKIVSVFTVITFTLNCIPVALAATLFTDVDSSHHNYQAIELLKTRQVISGYPDGTFQPGRLVTRAEFLRFALGAWNIQTDPTDPESGFKDVDEKAWYGPYVRKAKKEGWIKGYGDNTFHPEQYVNQVEGLKMIGEIEGWELPITFTAPFQDTPIDEWSTPYVAYAKSHNYFDDRGNYFIGSANLTRAKTSEIIARSLATELTGNDTFTPSLWKNVPLFPNTTPDTNIPPAVQHHGDTKNFTPVAYTTHGTSTYDKITLNQEFPNTFYTNEIYTFHGKNTDLTSKSALAFLKNDGGITENFENNLKGTENNTFSIPVVFRNPGNYTFAIAPTNATQSKFVNISVLPELPAEGDQPNTTTPGDIRLQYQNQKTTLLWSAGTTDIAKLTFTQGNIVKTFFTRQNEQNNEQHVDLPYSEFVEFQPTQIQVQISTATAHQTLPLSIDSGWTTGAGQTFKITTHQFSEVHFNEMTVNPLPETMPTTGTITVSGITNTDIIDQAVIIKPDGLTEKVTLGTNGTKQTFSGENIIPTGSTYTLKYTAGIKGTYILEINGKDGMAVLNTPVYVGNGTPLIPDFFDLPNSFQPDTSQNKNILIPQLLTLINQERAKYGLKTVHIDANLNTLAQNHADDMATRNFFGHINPDGLSPDDRRLQINISTIVGENLAKAPNLLYAHHGLMRSAIHRENILDPDWERVGLGINTSSDHSLLLVEEFAPNQMDATKLAAIKDSIYTGVNQQRAQQGLQPLTKNIVTESTAENWSTNMVQHNFFDFIAPNGDSLKTIIQKTVPGKNAELLILQEGAGSGLQNKITTSSQILDQTWKNIGIGILADTQGLLNCTLILSE